MTREKIEEAGDPIGSVRLREGLDKRRRDSSPQSSLIQLDAPNHFYSILLQHALLFHQLLPYRAGRTHVRHGYHHQAG
jgi:hypothetical protein